jgi:hypothetical protein
MTVTTWLGKPGLDLIARERENDARDGGVRAHDI